MSSPMNTLQSTLSPGAIAAGQNPALKTAGINHGAVLFELFTKDEGETAKVDAIRAMVVQYGLTIDEFKKSCKDAQEMASSIDTNTGWQAKQGATGADTYGPKRRVINQRVSEWRQLFGAFKVNPTLAQGQGYWNALEAARKFHAERGLKWDGSRAPTEAERDADRTTKANTALLEQAMKENMQQAGESFPMWMARLAQVVEQSQKDAVAKVQQDKVTALADKLMQQADSGMLQSLIATLQARLNTPEQPAPM